MIRRREFIPEMRALIAERCPIDPDAVNLAIDRWRDNEEAVSPAERGVFAVCDAIAQDLDLRAGS